MDKLKELDEAITKLTKISQFLSNDNEIDEYCHSIRGDERSYSVLNAVQVGKSREEAKAIGEEIIAMINPIMGDLDL